MFRKIFIRLSALALLSALVLTLASCSSPPALDEVRDSFVSLINASAEINDIFFGAGLPVYDRETSSGSGSALYDEATGTYYWIIEDEQLGTVVKYYDSAASAYYFVLKKAEKDGDGYVWHPEGGAYYYKIDYTEDTPEVVYDENSPVYYDYVLVDCEYQTVDSIKAAAEKVYSTDYLQSVYTIMFDGYADDNGGMIYARYMIDESGETDMFLKSNRFEPYFETQTTYDYSTMKIVSPSRSDYVNIELTANGRYIDYDTVEITTGEHTVTLAFILENGEWRLDTPTY